MNKTTMKEDKAKQADKNRMLPGTAKGCAESKTQLYFAPSNSSSKNWRQQNYAGYIKEATACALQSQGACTMSARLDHFDSVYQNLTPQNYITVMSEISDNEMIFHLLTDRVSQVELRGTAGVSNDIEGVVSNLTNRCLRDAPSRDLLLVAIQELDKGLLWKTLVGADYSFDIHEWQMHLPVPVKHHGPHERVYAAHYVDSSVVYSQKLAMEVDIPFMGYTERSSATFFRSFSFVHELIHLIQRVFRKNQVATYEYMDTKTGKLDCRNTEYRIARGIEDELEVSAILSRAYTKPFSIESTLYHIACLKEWFADRAWKGDYVERKLSSALLLIDFAKYESLGVDDIEVVIRAAAGLGKAPAIRL